MIDVLSEVKVGVVFMETAANIKGDVVAIAHKEWAKLVGVAGKLGARDFKKLTLDGTLQVHTSVQERKALNAFVQYANVAASKYNPVNY
jgi:hypothetical protein